MNEKELELKRIYDELVKENEDIVNSISSSPKNDRKMVDIIRNPRTIKEYEFAIAGINYFKITYEIFMNDDIELDPENNIVLRVYLDIMKALKNNDQERIEYIRKSLANYTDVKNGDGIVLGNILYDMTLLLKGFEDEDCDLIDYIIKECGCDPDDEDEVDELAKYFEEARKLAATSPQPDKLDFSNIENSKEIDNFIVAVKTYSEICGKNEEKRLKLKLY